MLRVLPLADLLRLAVVDHDAGQVARGDDAGGRRRAHFGSLAGQRLGRFLGGLDLRLEAPRPPPRASCEHLLLVRLRPAAAPRSTSRRWRAPSPSRCAGCRPGRSSRCVGIGSNLWSWQRAQPMVCARNALPIASSCSSTTSMSSCFLSCSSRLVLPSRRNVVAISLPPAVLQRLGAAAGRRRSARGRTGRTAGRC